MQVRVLIHQFFEKVRDRSLQAIFDAWASRIGKNGYLPTKVSLTREQEMKFVNTERREQHNGFQSEKIGEIILYNKESSINHKTIITGSEIRGSFLMN